MILAVATGMVFTMIVILVPVFEGVYARANTALPAPTRLLIAVSGVVRGYTLVVIRARRPRRSLLYLRAQSARGRRLIDGAKLRVPLFGPLVRKAVLARTCRTLSVLLSSGIPLIEAMGTVARVSGNRVIEDALIEATAHVQDGGTIADTLKRTGEFPSMVVQFVATGEESGTLPAMLARGGDLLRAAGRQYRGDPVDAHRAGHDRRDGRARGRRDLRALPADLLARPGH